MASSTSSVFSQTLYGITDSRSNDLSNLLTKIQEQKAKLFESLEHEENAIKRLVIFRDIIDTCQSLEKATLRQPSCGVARPPNITRLSLRFPQHLRFITNKKGRHSSVARMGFKAWEKGVMVDLDVMCNKLEYASLHAKLANEWLRPGGMAPTADNVAKMTTESLMDSDEEQKYLHQRQWEEDAFSPKHVDKANLLRFLEDTFVHETTGSVQKAKALQELSDEIKVFEDLLTRSDHFKPDTLERVITSLLASKHLPQEDRHVLRDIRSNQAILSDISDVLNSRMRALDSWSWGDGMSLDFRPTAGTAPMVEMKQDLLQAIFLHCIGVQWSVFFKQALTSFVSQPGPWLNTNCKIPVIDKKRREYFCGSFKTRSSVENVRQRMYRENCFLSRLVGPLLPGAGRVCDEGKRDFADGPTEAEQKIFQILSAEIAINTRLRGDFTVFHSSFRRWDRLIPHDTVYEVLSFFGVSEKWLGFFLKFLEAPLSLGINDPKSPNSRTIRRGMPPSHILSDVFVEVVFFCLDVAVNKETSGGLLYRSPSDLWFWNHSEDKVKSAWWTMQRFAGALGVRIRDHDND
ncbi:hypothetical protein PG997_010790 [Apiospora hydei]|uniref:Uncharacterized protein n=1 Tax=Apiospora hydei TaxID=1337664 RepID=A0ABR1VHF7_9PEZI